MAKRRLNERTRKLVREVGSIVLGVLIALFIGEVADGVRRRVDARRSLAAIRADMIDNSASFDLRPLADACSRRRLDELDAEIGHARRTGRLRDIGDIGSSGHRTFRSNNWDAAVGSGATLYLDHALVDVLADYHDGLASFRANMIEANMDWARLGVLSHAPGPIDDNTLSSVRLTLAELRMRNLMLTRTAESLLRNHRRVGFPVEYLPFNGRPRSRAQAIRDLRTFPLCRPLVVKEER